MSVSFFGLKMLLLFSLMRNNLFWCAKERRGWSDGLNYRTASHFIPTTTISIRVHSQPKRELAHYDLGKFLGISNGNSDSAFFSPFVCIPPLVPCPGSPRSTLFRVQYCGGAQPTHQPNSLPWKSLSLSLYIFNRLGALLFEVFAGHSISVPMTNATWSITAW